MYESYELVSSEVRCKANPDGSNSKKAQTDEESNATYIGTIRKNSSVNRLLVKGVISTRSAVTQNGPTQRSNSPAR